jgi:hypothetical protein
MSLLRIALLSSVTLAQACGGARPSVIRTANTDEEVDVVPEGTVIWARLEKPISATYSHLGEQVRVRTVTEVQDGLGRVLIQRGTLLTGSVTGRTFAGRRILIDIDTLELGGIRHEIKAHIVGTEAGFGGRFHAGDEVPVRFETAVRAGPAEVAPAEPTRGGGE